MAASVVGSLTVILAGLIAIAFLGDLGAALSQGPASPILMVPFLMGLVFGVQDSLFRKGNTVNRSIMPGLFHGAQGASFVVSRECSGSPWAATGAPPSPWASRAGDATRT